MDFVRKDIYAMITIVNLVLIVHLRRIQNLNIGVKMVIHNLRSVSITNGNKYWFDCNNCDNCFQMAIHHITNRNSWCGICKTR